MSSPYRGFTAGILNERAALGWHIHRETFSRTTIQKLHLMTSGYELFLTFLSYHMTHPHLLLITLLTLARDAWWYFGLDVHPSTLSFVSWVGMPVPQAAGMCRCPEFSC